MCKQTWEVRLVVWYQDSPLDEGRQDREGIRSSVEQAEPSTITSGRALTRRRKELLDAFREGVRLIPVMRIVEMHEGPALYVVSAKA